VALQIVFRSDFALDPGDFLDQLPVAAVQMRKNGLPLGFMAEAGSALLC